MREFLWTVLMGGLFVFALAILIWGWTAVRRWFEDKNKRLEINLRPYKVSKRAGALWQTAESEIDREYNEAMSMWPVLRLMPLFWISAAFLAVMLLLDVRAGVSRGGDDWLAIIILVALFCLFDLALFVVGLFGNAKDGVDALREKVGERRPAWQWMLIVIATLMSMYVVVASTTDTASTTAAARSAKVLDQQILEQTIAAKRDDLERVQTKLNQLGVQSNRETLERAAAAVEARAAREEARGGCGKRCEPLKAEAADARMKADLAKGKEDLLIEIAELSERLKARDGLRTTADPVADLAAAAGVPHHVTATWQLTVLGFFVVLSFPLLLLITENDLDRRLARLADINGRIADEKRAGANLPPKYTAPATAVQLLEHKPDEAAATGDTIIVNVAAEDMRKRYANDPDLLEVDKLFGVLLVADEYGEVGIADLYRDYRVATLKANPNARYMTEVTMVQKLNTVAQHRDDVAFTADRRILGWRLASTLAVAAAE